MATAILAAVASLEMICFGKDHIAVLHIILNFPQLTRAGILLWEYGGVGLVFIVNHCFTIRLEYVD